MNWEAIGAVGEIIGALAVFMTLVYLAIQIRQNTKAVQSSALDSAFNRISGLRHSLSENPELAQLYLKGGKDPASLDEIELTRYRIMLHNMFMSQSNIYFQTKLADLSTDTWDSQISVISRVLNSPGGQWFWENYSAEFETQFQDEVNKLMQSNE